MRPPEMPVRTPETPARLPELTPPPRKRRPEREKIREGTEIELEL